MKKVLIAFIALFSALWALDAFMHPIAGGDLLWQWRNYLLYYTGVVSFALMGFVMLLATRPVWAERWVGGMDQVYQLHKWAGIWAVLFAVSHWVIKLSKPIIIALIGNANRATKTPLLSFFSDYKSLAKSLGEWAIYAAIIMLVLTLWRSFPYKFWRHLHRIMPVLFLMVGFHALVLMPLSYWTQPIGLGLVMMLGLGLYGAWQALTQRIGLRHRYLAQVVQCELGQDQVLFLRAQVDARWPDHQPGQFAFICFDRQEGAHPFTIASAPHADGHIDFRIKALGDYTQKMAAKMRPHMFFEIEGPYGQFALDRINPQREQIWIAGGIGITPFIAWLEALIMQPQAVTAQLHYCIDRAEDSAACHYLQQLVAQLPTIHLSIHESAKGQRLTPEQLMSTMSSTQNYELWFCGPTGLLHALEATLKQSFDSEQLTIHSEAFQMR